MTASPARLPPSAGSGLGLGIDRQQALSFHLDGRLIHGFVGDTVLTAVLASGIDSVGWHDGSPLALDSRSAPAVRLVGTDDPLADVPMDRCPAIPGATFEVVANRPSRWSPMGLTAGAREVLGRTRSLRLDGLGGDVARRAWLSTDASERLTADLLVVGGGVAGLAAAARAARFNKRVILVERRLQLGGDADFFGRYGEEEPPETLIDRLATTLASSPNVTVLLNAEALSLHGDDARVHVVEVKDGRPHGRLLSISAPRRVLATGALERLPVFPGNRLPGVIGAVEAYRLVVGHAIWPGSSALLATSANAPYRLPLRLENSGVTFGRILDRRPRPQSRFIDFAKAVGSTQTTGTGIRSARLARRGGRLTIETDRPIGSASAGGIGADRLVVSGGWQPNLALWLQAGGRCHWDEARSGLAPLGDVPRLILAGAAAGYLSTAACVSSGEVATLKLFGRDSAALREMPADPAFETPDAAPSIAPLEAEGGGPSYLDRGRSLAEHTAPSHLRRLQWLMRLGARRDVLPSQPATSLEIGDLVSGVFCGMIPRADIGAVAEERCLIAGDDLPSEGVWAPAARGEMLLVQPYLMGRFGPSPTHWVGEAEDRRTLSTGALVHASADAGEPGAAIGVVLGMRIGGQADLLLEAGREREETVFIRELSTTVPVRLVGKALELDAAPATAEVTALVEPETAPAAIEAAQTVVVESPVEIEAVVVHEAPADAAPPAPRSEPAPVSEPAPEPSRETS